MNYSKPELAVLGDASSVIRGDKNTGAELDHPEKPRPSSFDSKTEQTSLVANWRPPFTRAH